MLNFEVAKRIVSEKPIVKSYIARKVEILPVDKIHVIIGPRRSGKTTLFFEIQDALRIKGVKDEQIFYLNFEDERLSKIEVQDLQVLLDAFYSLNPSVKSTDVYFMFDEIQNAPEWQKFIRRIYDKEGKNIYLTGSSAKMLSKEIATELRGRAITYAVFPFSFKEYLKAKNVNFTQSAFYSNERFALINEFEKYLVNGGFPEVVYENDFTRRSTLQTYYDTVIFRDVVERNKLANSSIARELFKFLLSNFSRFFSVNKFYNFAKSTGLKTSKDSLYLLVRQIEDTMYFHFVTIFNKSHAIKLVNPLKIYAVDNGLVTSLTPFKIEDLGFLYENLVAIELIRRGFELSYFKEKNECDFIAFDRNTNNYCAIQVTLDESKDREKAGLLEALNFLKLKEGLILTQNVEKEEEIEGKTIHFKPTWKWLLKN